MSLQEDIIQSIKKALVGLEYGTLSITVHESQIVQIDRIEKQRFPLKKQPKKKLTGQPEARIHCND